MTCQEFNNLMFDYIEGNLSSKQNKVIESHLQQCHKCKTAFHQYKDVVLKLHKLPDLKCPDTVVEKVYNSVPIMKTEIPFLTKIYQYISRRLSWKIRFAMGVAVVIISILSFYSGQEKKVYDQQIYTAEEIKQAKKDVEIALAYFNYYTTKAEKIIEKQIIPNYLFKPIKKAFKPIFNGG